MKSPFLRKLSCLSQAALAFFCILASFSWAESSEWIPVLQDGALSAKVEKKSRIAGTGFRIEGNTVVTFDESSEEFSFFYIQNAIEVPAGKTVIMETKMRVVQGLNGLSVTSKDGEIRLRFSPDRIEWREARKRVVKRTDEAFHTYRITMNEKLVRVEMDDAMILEDKPMPAPKVASKSDEEEAVAGSRLTFGSGNSSGTGEAAWELVRYRVE